MKPEIRNETESDFREVEEVTREAFWNLYVPGCDEHYLAHILRGHPDFLPELDFVAEKDGRIIGNIMYTKSSAVSAGGTRIETLTFGPLSVLPEFQRKGVGSALVEHSLKMADNMGYKAVIILGNPDNYCKFGFKNGKDLGVSDPDGKYPYGLLVLELEKGIFGKNKWKYEISPAYNLDPEKTEEFDKGFEEKKKEFRYTQEQFSMAVRAFLD